MDWIPLAALVVALSNGAFNVYMFTVNHREPPHKGKHRRKPERKRRKR